MEGKSDTFTSSGKCDGPGRRQRVFHRQQSVTLLLFHRHLCVTLLLFHRQLSVTLLLFHRQLSVTLLLFHRQLSVTLLLFHRQLSVTLLLFHRQLSVTLLLFHRQLSVTLLLFHRQLSVTLLLFHIQLSVTLLLFHRQLCVTLLLFHRHLCVTLLLFHRHLYWESFACCHTALISQTSVCHTAFISQTSVCHTAFISQTSLLGELRVLSHCSYFTDSYLGTTSRAVCHTALISPTTIWGQLHVLSVTLLLFHRQLSGDNFTCCLSHCSYFTDSYLGTTSRAVCHTALISPTAIWGQLRVLSVTLLLFHRQLSGDNFTCCLSHCSYFTDSYLGTTSRAVCHTALISPTAIWGQLHVLSVTLLCLTWSPCTDTPPTSPETDPITQGVC